MALPKGIDLLPSGKFRARFMHGGRKYSQVCDTQAQAEAWKRRTLRDLDRGTHDDSAVADGEPEPLPLLKDYSADWLKHRQIKTSTRNLYAELLDRHILPALGGRRLDAITPAVVRDWHRTLLPEAPTRRAHAYGLLRTILNTAVSEELLTVNPCRIKAAGTSKRAGTTDLPTVEQVGLLVAAMPAGKYRTMTLMAAWTGVRFGELTELRRKDLVPGPDGRPVAVKIRRAVYRGIVDTPKSGAGVRDISIPPHIRADLAGWVDQRPKAADTLLFPGARTNEHMPEHNLREVLHRARDKAGVPTLRWHDLRHFSATTAAQTGASLAELQRRLGHSTVNAAMRYQHAAQGRDAEIAEAMSKLAAPAPKPVSAIADSEPQPETSPMGDTPPANVVPIRPVPAPSDTFVSLTAAAKRIRVTLPQLRKLIDKGELPTVRHKGREMVQRSDLEVFLAADVAAGRPGARRG